MTLFDRESLHADVLAQLAKANIPPDDKIAVVIGADTSGTAHAVVAIRGGDHWQLEVGAAVDKHHGAAGAVGFKGSWGK